MKFRMRVALYYKSGNYSQGADISFNGLTVNLDIAAGGATQTFTLDAPKNDNILNTMNEMITALRDPATTTDQLTAIAAAKTEVHSINIERLGELNTGKYWW